MVVVVLLFANQFVAVFNSENSAQLASYASLGLRLYFLGFLVAAINIIKSGFFSAVGKGMESSVIALSRGVFAISLMAFALSRAFGINGVWLSFLASEIITLALSSLISAVKKDRLDASEAR